MLLHDLPNIYKFKGLREDKLLNVVFPVVNLQTPHLQIPRLYRPCPGARQAGFLQA